MVLRLGEELRALGRPFPVDLVDVRDATIEKRARGDGVTRRGEGDGRLVICGTTTDVEVSQEFATFMMTGSRSMRTCPSNNA